MIDDVLVVGAGIAGSATAAALCSHGIDVDVAERSTGLRTTGAGILLHPNARACLEAIDIDPRGHGADIARQVSIAMDGTRTVVDWRHVWGGETLPLGIHRRTLARLLLAGAPQAQIRWGTHPLRIAERADHVAVELSDGTEGRYRLVIGADGVRSWVRGRIDPVASPKVLDQIYWRTTVPAVGALDFPDWRVWTGRGRFFGGMPIGGGESHVFLQAGTARRFSSTVDGDRVGALLAEMGDGVQAMGAVLLGPGARMASATELSLRRWTNGRIGLVGDAAHALSPSASQGGAMAIEDAVVLAEEISRRGATAEALAAYERRRRPRVELFARRARLHSMLMNRGPAAAGGQTPSPGSGSSVRWFRRLYEPLMTVP